VCVCSVCSVCVCVHLCVRVFVPATLSHCFSLSLFACASMCSCVRMCVSLCVFMRACVSVFQFVI
jgi:hypothetical protein